MSARLRRRARLGAVVVAVLAATLLPASPAAETAGAVPTITPILTGHLGKNGWYLGDTTVAWTYSDPVGIKRTEGCDTRTVERETTGTQVTCRVTNMNDVTVASTVTIRIDKRPPRVRPRGIRPPDGHGWYNHRIQFTPGATDSSSGIAWCTRIPSYAGPDRRKIKVGALCGDAAGRKAWGRLTFKYDGTPPRRVRAVRQRAPDKYGWYARDLRIHYVGRDGLSGLARCASRTYKGPDTAHAKVNGGCRDRAGNVRRKLVRFKFSKPLLVERRGGRPASPPLLDWVDVGHARRYNVQLWLDGRKLLSRWPAASELRLRWTWKYGGDERRLRRGERYAWYVWPLFARGYGEQLGQSTFRIRRP
jgi:hypothetical protein